jgi:hypothetical protein
MQQQSSTNAETVQPSNLDLDSARVVRVRRHHAGYIVIDRATAQDQRLTWEARGMLLYLLSLPDNWNIRVAHLQKHGGAGRDAVRRILSELQTLGYLSGFGRLEEGARGKAKREITVYEAPDLNPYFQAEGLTPEKPTPEKASPYKVNRIQNTDLTKLSLSLAPDAKSGEREISKFSLEARKAHAAKNGLGTGWLQKSETGIYDWQLEDSAKPTPQELSASEPLPARNLAACPDCHGTNFFYPEGHNKGVTRCQHSRLGQESPDERPALPLQPPQERTGGTQATRPTTLSVVRPAAQGAAT